jgi:parallel beta-helix repeat protein
MARLYFVLMLCLLFQTSFGQPLSGNYTIGGSGADYTTINAAVSDLSSLGVNGPVVFSITSGVYNESLVIGPVNGASAVNTITFQSAALDSTAVTITAPATTTSLNNYLIRLSAASYINFRYLTFERTGSNDYSLVIDIANASQYISFYRNQIIGPQATIAAMFKCLVYGANASTQSNITFDGNRMSGGSYGIWLAGNSQLPCCTDNGNVIKNNHLINQYQCGIYLQYQNGPQITGNIIEGSSAASGFGIYTFFADNNLRILKNKVSVINGKGIYVHNTSIAGIPENLIANNFVSVGGAGTAEGIILDNSKSCHLYHNSIHIYNTASSSAAFRINGIGSSFNELKNNNLVNSGGGYAMYVAATTTQPFNLSDYNNLYVTDTLLGFWQASGSHADLPSFRTASNTDINSVSLDPGYLSNTDLHATSVLLNNRGTPALSSATPVTDDIDGEPRSLMFPDIGADEYSVNDLRLLAIDSLWSFVKPIPVRSG